MLTGTPLQSEGSSQAEIEDTAKNLINLNESHMIDIPPQLTSVVKYRASLGHKVRLLGLVLGPQMNRIDIFTQIRLKLKYFVPRIQMYPKVF